VLALAEQHGVPAVEAACTTALEVGVPNYRLVRRYLERHPPGLPTLRQIDPLVRQLNLYRDLLDRAADKEAAPMTLPELDRALRQLRLFGHDRCAGGAAPPDAGRPHRRPPLPPCA
jgi:hypothetical protein